MMRGRSTRFPQRLGALVAAGFSAAVACGGSGGQPAPVAPTSSPTPVAAPCAVAPSGAPGPITDPSGPFFHQVVAAQTSDGITIRDTRQVLDHASVPDGVRLADGSLRIYYVNGAEGAVWVARLDADGAAPIGPIAINGVARPQGVVDPDATRLPDGRVRLAYLSGFGAPGSAMMRAMCLADSTDGERFTVVGAAVTFGIGDTTTDPSLLQLRNGSWLMAMSRGQTTMLARSPDGESFTIGETLTFGGVPELALLGDGRVRLYVCANGIESYVSDTDGATWQREATVVRPSGAARIVCDPSRIAGSEVFLYKTAS